VCHLIERLDYGGGETLVHTLATGMRESPYLPIVCCLQSGPLASRLERDGIRVHCLNLRRRSVLAGPFFVLSVLRILWRLTKLVKTEQVAIIHAHLSDCIILGVLAGALTRTPVVGTYHGLGIFPQGRRRADPRNALRRAFYRLAGRLADRTIAVSPPVRELLCHEMGLDERKTVLVLNGVDTGLLARAAASSGTRTELGLDNRTIVVCVGRLVPWKGQRFLIDAMADVVKRYATAALLLVGSGPELASLEEQIRALGLSNHVRFAADRSDVPELLAMSTIFVLPSFYEGIPLALVEAMAAGKPVVATAVPGNADVVLDDRFGLLVPARDAKALAGALCTLLDDPDRAATMAARGQERVQMLFDVKRSLAATTALYDEVLAEREARRHPDGSR
jgi:glycosyltransferase involved in cell wall biosynthesis